MQQHTSLVSLGPLHNTIVDLNKSKIIRNGGELSDLEYLPPITEYIKYLQNVDMQASHLFGPIKQHYSHPPLNDTVKSLNSFLNSETVCLPHKNYLVTLC